MQSFKNNPRRSAAPCPCPSDIFPLCRGDRAESTQMSRASSCGKYEAPSCPLTRDGGEARERRTCGCMNNEVLSCANVNTPTSEDFDCEGLAIALVPYEEFADLNGPEEALCRGSLFQRLDMPFYGGRRRNCKC